MLHILVNIQSETEFNEVLRKFLDRYKQVEPAFIQYFEDNYSSRNGNMLLTIIIALHYYATEKWAMCFRKFTQTQICILKGLLIGIDQVDVGRGQLLCATAPTIFFL